MPVPPKTQPWSTDPAPDLLSKASSVLAREAMRAPLSGAAGSPGGDSRTVSAAQELAARVCPVTGAAVPLQSQDKDTLRQQAHQLVAALLGSFGQGGSPLPGPSPSKGPPTWSAMPADLGALAGQVCPVTKAAVPMGGFDKDQLRKQAHEFIETLLITFSDATGERGLPAEDKVPSIQCASPVRAGTSAYATLRLANDDSTPSTIGLYCTPFISDSGYEISTSRVSVSPRRTTISPRGEGKFEITIAVPQQTPPGFYSALIQATGRKYVKAVLSVEVL